MGTHSAKRRRSGSAKRPRRLEESSSSGLDFRATADDAWWLVQLRPERRGAVLRVSYCGFTEAADEQFEADGFRTLADVEEFRSRFRPTSVQLQDSECKLVVKGMEVSVSHEFGENEVRFYNAVVEEVNFSEHSGHKDEDVCSCTFVVVWKHGPMVGEKTIVGIESICSFKSQGLKLDPVLDHFIDMAKKKCDATNSARTPKTAAKHTFCGPPRNLNCEQTGDITDSSFTVWREGKKNYNKGPQDLYLGSSMTRNKCLPKCYYFFQIWNIERDLSPACISEFLLEQTSIYSVAIILPELSSKYYSTATIFVETKEKAEKLSEFLFNPGHIIMSSQDRPWVISAEWQGSIEGKMPKYEEPLTNEKGSHSGKLKLVTVETKEYVLGKEILELHKEFRAHEELLHKSLERERNGITRRFLGFSSQEGLGSLRQIEMGSLADSAPRKDLAVSDSDLHMK